MQMTQESIDAFGEKQKENGASKDSLRQRKGFVSHLYQWLPDDKLLTKERLSAWSADMRQKGDTQQTILNYAKKINLYPDFMGWSNIRFNRGSAKDIRNLTFGYLTLIEPTDGRHRKDVVWRCNCKCGDIVELPATRLLVGNTLSCGCTKAENIRTAGKTIAGTSLVMSLKEDVRKADPLSGYTGVSPKRDKWYAHITYRGKRYNLGTYTNIEDAVKARARAKELVMEDALQLLELFGSIHRDDYKPNRETLPKVEIKVQQDEKEKTDFLTVARSDSTSGYTGVSQSRKKWKAYIPYKGKWYTLGYFTEKNDAIAARKKAEKQLREGPTSFMAC